MTTLGSIVAQWAAESIKAVTSRYTAEELITNRSEVSDKCVEELSKKVKGSNNRKKAQHKIAKLFERITNKKDAYIHYV